MTDPIRKKQGTPLPLLPQPMPNTDGVPVKEYNLDEMVIDGSLQPVPKPETFGVSRLWQSQSKDPTTLMIVYDGDIQKYRQHFIAYVSHLIRHYEEMGVTPNVGLATPAFQMAPIAMNDMGKGDLFSALLDLDPKGMRFLWNPDLYGTFHFASETLSHPQFHGDQKTILLFKDDVNSAALVSEKILLEAEGITLNVVLDFSRGLRFHGGETLATWEEVTADLRSAMAHIRPEVLEDRASRTDEFFLRLGAAQLKYTDKPLLELIHAVQKDWMYGAPIFIKNLFTLPNCTLSREGCNLNLDSATIYFDYLREIGTSDAFQQYTDYVLTGILSPEEMLNLLRYASIPVETLIDTLIRPENSARVEVAAELLRPENLTDAQKERIRSRIEAMIPVSHDDMELLSNDNRRNFREALKWRIAFNDLPEVRSLDDRFINGYQMESEDLIFENAKLLHPDLPVAAFRHAIDFAGKNFLFEGQWQKFFKQISSSGRIELIVWLFEEANEKPYTIRYFSRLKDADAEDFGHPRFGYWYPSYENSLELYPIMRLSEIGRFDKAFDLIVKLKTETPYDMEDPTATKEDPEPTHQYLWELFQKAVQVSTSNSDKSGLISRVVEYLTRENSHGDVVGKLFAEDLVTNGIFSGIDLYMLLEIIGMENPKSFYFVAENMVRNYPEEYFHLVMAPYFMTVEAKNKSTQERLQILIPLLRSLDQRLDVYSEPSKDREILKMWADRLTDIIRIPGTETLIRQMILYRVQRIVRAIGCTEDVDLLLGPRSNAMQIIWGNHMADEIWRESLKPIQEACGEK